MMGRLPGLTKNKPKTILERHGLLCPFVDEHTLLGLDAYGNPTVTNIPRDITGGRGTSDIPDVTDAICNVRMRCVLGHEWDPLDEKASA
jgi:hypothetical protein